MSRLCLPALVAGLALLITACGEGPDPKTTTTKAPEAVAPGAKVELPPQPPEKAPSASRRTAVPAGLDTTLASYFDASRQQRIYLQVDKPLYKPGETIWLRAWDLKARDLSGFGAHVALVQLISPKGAAVVEKRYRQDQGFVAADIDLPPEVNGGEYTLRFHAPDGVVAERPLIVSRYEPPRLKKKLEFARKAYGENDVVTATFELKRPTGEPLANHPITALLRLDGEELPRVETTTNAEGGALVKVQLPAKIAVGDGLLTILVEDGGVTESIGKAVPIIMKRMQLSFFPEGGALVTGLPSRVYFEAKTPLGKPADVRGEIVDDQGQVVTTFESYKEGLGRFVLSPAVGRTYSARITKPEGIIDTIILPEAKEDGCVLRTFDDVDGQRGAVVAGVTCTSDQEVAVVATVRDNLLDAAGLAVTRGKQAVVELKGKDGMQDAMGVARISVLSSTRQPLAERLFFMNRRARLGVKVKPLKDKHGPRDQVALQVTTTNPDGTPVPAELAMAVVDDTVISFADDKTGHMLARLYLEPELPGKVEEPNLFFDLTDDKSALALELLMGTRGWRTFAWADAFSAGERFARGGGRKNAAVDTLAAAPGAADAVMFDEEDGAAMPKGGRMPAAPMGVAMPKAAPARPAAMPAAPMPAAPPPPAEARGPVAAPIAAAPPPPDVLRQAAERERPVVDAKADRAFAGEKKIEARLEVAEDKDWAGAAAGGLAVAEEMPARRRRPGVPVAVARVFPAPSYGGPPPALRTDFRETIHWAPQVKTGKDGTAVVTFFLSDAVTSFRVFTEGVGAGRAGRDETVFDSTLPFSMAVKLPLEVSAGDRIAVPLTLSNETDAAVDVDVKASFGPLITARSDLGGTKALAQTARASMVWDLDVTGMSGESPVSFSASGSGLTDEFTRTLRVVPRGFPIEQAFSGTVKDKVGHTFDTGAAVKGTLTGVVRLYPSPTSTLISGLEGMLRQPSGCFEQTSSTNYPNVMIASYLEKNNIAAPDIAARAQQLMDDGYKKLVGFETKEKGYEWFGGAPGHEALTAYGLLEFMDMKAVYGGVDDAMVQRTAAWLKQRRDGKGGYTRNPRALDSFGGAPPEVTNAYITWALSEAKTTGIDAEVQAEAARATSTTDAYQLALATNTLFNAGRTTEAESAAKKLAAMQDATGAFTKAATSITRSGGQNLHLETTALSVLALLKSSTRFPDETRKAVEWMTRNRGMYGQWGATQATVLSLKAFIAYVEANTRTQNPGTVIVKVNGVVHKTVNYEAGHKDPIVIDDLGPVLTAGQNEITILLDGSDALPYTVGLAWRSTSPASAPDAIVDLAVKADKTSVRMGEPVRVTATVSNKTPVGQPMTLARVGIPGGLVSQDWQLKKLREEGRIAFYETRAREVILYFRDLAPNARHEIPIDLVATVPGSYEAPASSAYLYYTDDKKTWVEPLRVEIEHVPAPASR
jgi:alpha-2-macroglobulin-like protein